MKREFKPYSTNDYTVINHPQYPKTTQIFHETPQQYGGRIVHQWTHRRALKSLFHCTVRYRIILYAKECMKTFTLIPDYHVFSASEYAKTHNTSHVTAKKRLLKLANQPNSNIIQLTPRYFVAFNDEIARQFIVAVMQAFYADAAPMRQGGMGVGGNVTLPQILRNLQRLKEYALYTKSGAFYNVVKIKLTQPVLTWLIKRGFMARLTLDFMATRGSIVYMACR